MNRKTLFALAAALLIGATTFAQQPKREMRSVWIAAMGIDWPRGSGAGTDASAQSVAKQQMITFLDNYKAHNFTSVCVHVRPLADALYKSSYEPWSASVSGVRGKDPGWDPLAWVVEECHKRGLECWAWINPFRICHRGTETYEKSYNTPQDIEWRENGWVLHSGDWYIFNPAIEGARKHSLNVIKEVYTNYDVDGLLFDDYFYGGDGTPTNSTAGDWQQYQDYKAANNSTIGIADWRRMNVNTFVKELYDMIQADRPDMRFGISPAGVAGKSAPQYGLNPPSKGSDWMYNKIYCDPLAWMNDHSIDFISPQIYWARTNNSAPYSILNEWWSDVAEHFGNCHYYASLASYKVYTSEFGGNNADGGWLELDAQVRETRQHTPNNAPGQIFYNASALDGPDYNGLGNYLEQHSYSTPALTPLVDWKERVVYPAPANAAFDGTTLTWDAAEAAEKAIIRYTVYAVPYSLSYEEALATDGDGLDIKYLTDISYSTSYVLPEELRTDHWYAVCVYDGYGYESEISTIGYTGERSGKAEIISPKNGEATTWETVFSWTPVEGATYNVEISTYEDFSYIVAEAKHVETNSTTFNLGRLQDNTLCYWRVITCEKDKIYTSSDAESFRSPIRDYANAPALLTPAQDEQLDEGDITFSWGESTYATTYKFRILRPNGELVFSASFESPTTSITLNSAIFGFGDFCWDVTAMGSRILTTVSETGRFTIVEAPMGTYEPGYSITLDPAKYTAANGAQLSLESLWTRPAIGGAMNNGMIAAGNYVYLTGRTEDNKNADIYLSQYNIKTGEHIRDIALSEEGKVTNLPCNDIIKDSEGNICIVNQTTSGMVRPIYIHLVDIATGQLTEVARVKSDSRSVSQIDHAAVYGDVTSGDFIVFAAVAKKGIVLRRTLTSDEEAETTCEMITLTEFAEGAKNFGAAPRIIAIDESKFYIDGGNILPAIYDFDSEELVCAMPTGSAQTGDNGMMPFELNGKYYFAYSAVPAASNAQFGIGTIDEEYALNTLSNCFTFPQSGLGSNDCGTAAAPVDIVATGDRCANVIVFSPGNGLAAYSLTDTEGAGIADIETDALYVRAVGTTLNFSREVAVVKAYTTTGALAASATNANSLTLPGAGLYAIVADGISRMIVVTE